MKVEIEIPDFEELYCTYGARSVTGTDVKKALIDFAVEKFIDQLYNNHVDDNMRSEIVQQANFIVKEHSGQ